jgi:hypothetical protein
MDPDGIRNAMRKVVTGNPVYFLSIDSRSSCSISGALQTCRACGKPVVPLECIMTIRGSCAEDVHDLTSPGLVQSAVQQVGLARLPLDISCFPRNRVNLPK